MRKTAKEAQIQLIVTSQTKSIKLSFDPHSFVCQVKTTQNSFLTRITRITESLFNKFAQSGKGKALGF